MQHEIPVGSLGPQGHAMAEAVEACVHCGFCLPTCPTYLELGEEMDSPRGRILLMKGVLEGDLAMDQALPYVDRCLGCLACVTACPSGVEYGELLTPFREHTEPQRQRPAVERLTRLLTNQTLPYPMRFRMAARLGRLAKPLHRFLPDALATMLDLLPDALPSAQPLPLVYRTQNQPRARVALLSGCVQQVLAPQINWATLRVLAHNGVTVVVPPTQGCCGALSMHTGAADQARALARRNLRAFDLDAVDAVVTNAAGCGSGMKEYGLLFSGEPEEEQARRLAQNTVDVSVFLSDLGIEPPPALPQSLTVAYHDACHLAHAQGVRSAPRQLLDAIPNVKIVSIPEAEICCGSAGSYNIEQPDLARRLGERKADNVLSTGADAVVTGNIGCMTQIDNHLRRQGSPLPVFHTVELLDWAYRGDEAMRRRSDELLLSQLL